MYKGFCCFILLSLSIASTRAQTDIEPLLVISDTVNFQFTGEWQYLSTDIYLFNGDRFSNLINELEFSKLGRKKARGLFRRRRTALAEEYLEYLFITARLKNVKFFGKTDITYPLYNFQINRDKEMKYHTYVSDNIESIRIIDNLPLYSANDFIDAEIQVKAITNNDRDQILGLVASQLKSLATIQTPTHALLGIIGEFGNFIEANTKRREYRFSSTIRLFEQKNFDSRLHSLRVYVLLTQNSTPDSIDTAPIKALLDTASNPEISRSILQQLINYRQYPLIVVANYKSLYRMEHVTGDEVNFASIEKRKLKIENDFRAGLINTETYRQERDFINFITIFANLKNHLEVYGLNHRTGNSEAISGSLFTIMQLYRQLLRQHQEILLKYRGNSTFLNVFGKEYQAILEYASLYLDEDHTLRNLKDLVRTLIALEKSDEITGFDQMEATVATLRFADNIRHQNFNQSAEGEMIRMHTQRLENSLLQNKYTPAIVNLNRKAATQETRNAPDTLRSMVRNTSCLPCRDKAFEAINNFAQRVEDHQRDLELERLDSTVKQLQPWIFEQLIMVSNARVNLDRLFALPSQAHTRSFLDGKLKEIERDLFNLQDFSRKDLSGKELHLVQGLIQRIGSTRENAQSTIALVCGMASNLCTEPTPEVLIHPTIPVPSIAAFNDSIVEHYQILVSIFETQLNGLIQSARENSVQMNPRAVNRVTALLNDLTSATMQIEKSNDSSKLPEKTQEGMNRLAVMISDGIDKLKQKAM